MKGRSLRKTEKHRSKGIADGVFIFNCCYLLSCCCRSQVWGLAPLPTDPSHLPESKVLKMVSGKVNGERANEYLEEKKNHVFPEGEVRQLCPRTPGKQCG